MAPNNSTIGNNLDEVRRHLMLLHHEGGGVTQIQIERWFQDEQTRKTARRNGSPLRWIGIYEPAKYDKLLTDLVEFHRRHPQTVFNTYVAPNPRREEALAYAPNRLRSSLDIWREEREPRFVDGQFVIRTCYFMDLDHKGGGKDRPTTKAQKQEVLTLARRLVHEDPLLGEASILDSGNNAYLLARLPPGSYTDEAVKALHYRLVQRHGLDPHARGGAVNLDPSWDGFRIMGLAGTLKRKGTDPRRWRMQRVLVEGGVCQAMGEELHRIEDELGQAPPPRPPRSPGPPRPVEEGSAAIGELEETISTWCSGYREVWEEPEVEDRSQALFGLGIKMLADSWAEGDAVLALKEWSLRRRYRRPDRWYDRLVRDVRTKLGSGVLPAHSTVERLLGRCSCTGGCDVEALHQSRRLGAKLEVLDWDQTSYPAVDKPAPVGLVLKDARDDLEEFIKLAIGQRGGRPPQAMLFAGPPGIGKTHIARELTRAIPTLYLVNRLEEFEKFRLEHKDGDLHLVEIGSRIDRCEVPEARAQLQALEERGLGRYGGRVCEACPRNQQCAYFIQFTPVRRSSIVATTFWLFSSKLRDLARQVELIVIDEDPFDYAFRREALSARGLDALDRVVADLGGPPPLAEAVQVARTLLSLPGAEWNNLARGDGHLRDWVLGHREHMAQLADADLDHLAGQERRLLAQMPVEQLPPMSAVYLARTLRRLVRAGRGAWCPTYLSGDSLPSRALKILSFSTVTVQKPVLALDATGSLALYRKLFPRHRVEIDPAYAQLQAQVVQVCDQALPMATLADQAKLEKVEELVAAIARKRIEEVGPGVLVVARKAVLERMKLPEGVETIHYGGQRGSRSYENCHTSIVVGAAEPPPSQIQAMTEAMLKRPVSRERKNTIRPYLLESEPGKTYAAKLKVYRSKYHQELLERAREGEMIQAAYRIRPLDTDRENLQIFVLSRLPLALLPPDELVTLAELERRFSVGEDRLIDRIRRARDELVAEGLRPTQAEIARKLGISRQAVSKAIRDAGDI